MAGGVIARLGLISADFWGGRASLVHDRGPRGGGFWFSNPPMLGCYGSAHCRAMSRGQSTAQNGAAAEESVRVMRLAETTSRAPARRTLSRRRRRLQPVPVAFAMARRAMCMT